MVLQAACCERDCSDCTTCMGKLQSTINYAFKLCGGIGLFFSFTEVRPPYFCV
jgi:tetraspanin-13/31